jgi:hypothetical protein
MTVTVIANLNGVEILKFEVDEKKLVAEMDKLHLHPSLSSYELHKLKVCVHRVQQVS